MKHLYTLLLWLLISATGFAQTPLVSIGSGVNLKAGTDLINLGNSGSLSNSGSLTGSVKGLRTIASSTLLLGSSTATLSTNISGSSMQYQWQRSADGINNWINLPSAKSATYVTSTPGFYRAALGTSNSGYEQFTPAQQISNIASDSFVEQFTFTDNSQTGISLSTLTTATVNYTYSSNLGKSGSGSFNSPTFGENNTAISIPGLISGEVVTLVIEPFNLKRIQNYNTFSANFVTDISQWGSVVWSNMTHAFSNCPNINVSATDVPNLTQVTDMANMFAGCNKLTGPSNVGSWDVSSVTFMPNLFAFSPLFNQDLSGWDVSKVTHMGSMFYGATSFNNGGSPGIANWDVRKAEIMWHFFHDAPAFNQNIGKWTLHPNANLSNMLDNSGLNCQNYSGTLSGWANNASTPNGRSIGAAGLTYGTDAVAARNKLITSKGWVITGDLAGGSSCIPAPILSTIPNQATCDGTPITGISFTATGDTTGLTFTTSSSNASITPVLTFGGTPSNRTLNIGTTQGQLGLTTVSVIATNSAGGKDTSMFELELGNKTVNTGTQNTVNFPEYSAANSKFIVPTGVTSLAVELIGGTANPGSGGSLAGIGGRVQATIPVTPGTEFRITSAYNNAVGGPDGGGFGYGIGGTNGGPVGAGGGSSAIVQNGIPIIVAGGGGGGAHATFFSGSGGGGLGTGASVPTNNCSSGAAGNFPGGNGGSCSPLTNGSNGTHYIAPNYGITVTSSGTGTTPKVSITYTPVTITYTACNAKPVFTNLSANFKNDTFCISQNNFSLGNSTVNVSDPDGTIASTLVTSSNPALVTAVNTGDKNSINIILTQQANQSGTATIKVVSTDNLGAKDSVSFAIKVNAVAIDSTTGANVLCHGLSTGSLTVSPTGGTAPYSYTWTTGGSPTGSNSPSISGLSAGTYNVSVSDKFFCSANRNLIISQPEASLTIKKDSSNISCFGLSDGFASAKPAGGTAPYTWLWNDNTTSHEVINQSAGSKSVNVTDNNGCKATASFILSQPAEIVINTHPSDANVCVDTDTIIGVKATGGTLSYQWYASNGGNISQLSNGIGFKNVSDDTLIATGNLNNNATQYFVRVSQTATCYKESSKARVIARVCNISPEIASLSNQELCQNGSTSVMIGVSDVDFDSVTVAVSSDNTTLLGSGSMVITPSKGAYNAADRKLTITPTIGQSGIAKVMIVATDARGGRDTAYFNLKVNALPAAPKLTYIPPVCQNTEAFNLTQGQPVGGVYTVNGEVKTVFDPSAYPAGTYIVKYTVDDQNGCENSVFQNVTIKIVTQPQFSNPDSVCQNQGLITLNTGTPVGGVYSGTGVSTGTFNPQGLTGIQTLLYTYKNQYNCSAAAKATVFVKSTPIIIEQRALSLCSNSEPLVLSYAGSPDDSVTFYYKNQKISRISPVDFGEGVHKLTFVVMNSFGCSDSGSLGLTISVPQKATLENVSDKCSNSTAVQLIGQPLGGTYYGDGVIGAIFDPKAVSTTSAVIKYVFNDTKGCSDTASQLVNILPSPDISITASALQFCSGEHVELKTSGGRSYQWLLDENEVVDEVSAELIVTQAGKYAVEATGANGCKAVSSSLAITENQRPSPEIHFLGDNNFCDADTLKLSTYNYYNTYKWFRNSIEISGAQDSTLIITSGGTYSVQVSDQNCSGTSESILLLDQGNATISSNVKPAICKNTSLILTSSDASTYTWKRNGDLLPNQTRSITVSDSGMYTVEVVTAKGCKLKSLPFEVVLKALPEVKAYALGATEFCEGLSTVLSADSTFSIYRWQKDGDGIFSTNFKKYKVTQSGDYAVTVTDANGCRNTSNVVKVEVNETPDRTINLPGINYLCSNRSLEIVSNAQGASIQWLKGGQPIASETGNALIVNSAGTYRAALQSDKGCADTSSSAIVFVKTAPEVPTITMVDSSLISSEAASYQWYKDQVKLEGETFQTLKLLVNGVYSVEIGNGQCTEIADYAVVNLSIDELQGQNSITAFPNPFNGFIQLTTTGTGSYQLFDVAGKLILTGTVDKTITLGTEVIASGIYTLRVQFNTGEEKLVKLVK